MNWLQFEFCNQISEISSVNNTCEIENGYQGKIPKIDDELVVQPKLI